MTSYGWEQAGYTQKQSKSKVLCYKWWILWGSCPAFFSTISQFVAGISFMWDWPQIQKDYDILKPINTALLPLPITGPRTEVLTESISSEERFSGNVCNRCCLILKSIELQFTRSKGKQQVQQRSLPLKCLHQYLIHTIWIFLLIW